MESLKNVSKYELRDIIDNVTHQLQHLERSQRELLVALQEDPNDEDFQAAYQENQGVIAKKVQARKEMKEYLKEIDIAYYTEHYKDAVGGEATQAQNADQANTNNSEGVYL